MASFEVVEPQSLEEAFGFLDPEDPAIRPIGGGTALMLMMKAQLYKPLRLVSLHRIGGRFTGITFDEGRSIFRIGAMTTFTELERSPEICNRLPMIGQIMKTLANVRVRHVATVGGNLAHADPHLDLPPAWAALGAHAVILRAGGERSIPVEDLFTGYYETQLANDDLIAELEVPVRPGWRSHYVKVTTRAAHDWPALGLALSADIAGRTINDIRFVLSAAVDRPTRLRAAEAVLRGSEVEDAVLHKAGEAAAEEIDIKWDSRGSSDYKKYLLRVHLRRALQIIAAG